MRIEQSANCSSAVGVVLKSSDHDDTTMATPGATSEMTPPHAAVPAVITDDEESLASTETTKSGTQQASNVTTATASQLSDLPQSVLQEIVSYLWDDRTSIGALRSTCQAVSQSTPLKAIRDHLQAVVLAPSSAILSNNTTRSSSSSSTRCCFCEQTLTYPYQLRDCQHVACGHCLWMRVNNNYAPKDHHACGCCGTPVRNRPIKLSPEVNRLAEVRAFWLLTAAQNVERWRRHDRRIHQGTAGYFGIQGTSNRLDPFCGKGFPGEFDDLPALRLAELRSGWNYRRLLPAKTELWVTLCPAAFNYSGFPEAHGRRRRIRQVLREDNFFQDLSERDIVIVEEEVSEEDIYSNNIRSDRFEVRLVGWEHLAAGNGDLYSSSDDEDDL